MKQNKYITFYLFICCIISLSACNGGDMTPDEDDNINYEYETLLADPTYSQGFWLGSTDESNGNVQGKLDYDGTATGTPVWKLAQWNCINNDMADAIYSVDGNLRVYQTAGGNKVTVDSSSGSISLELNTTSEYGLNGITSNPRKENEPWPTILIEYSLGESDILKVADQKEIRMEIAYNINKVENHIPAGQLNTNLHSAQFQWFVTIQNRTIGSPDFGRYIWFGLNFYDKRYEYAPFYAAEDGGKENNTGAFIYMPDMMSIMGVQGGSKIGKDMKVDVDILPIVKEAFKLAQQRHYLLDTTWNDLYIGATNIGWEVTGTYNVAASIQTLSLKYR